MELVIQNDAMEFLVTEAGGGSWSSEYPDAQLFNSVGAARKALRKVDEYGLIEVIENYGMENQAVVYSEKRAQTEPS